MNAHVGNLRTLVLNADLQPLSWARLSVRNWQHAFITLMQESVGQPKTYDDIYVHSSHDEFEVPAMVALKRYRGPQKVSFARQYVIPHSRSGSSPRVQLYVAPNVLSERIQSFIRNIHFAPTFPNFLRQPRSGLRGEQ